MTVGRGSDYVQKSSGNDLIFRFNIGRGQDTVELDNTTFAKFNDILAAGTDTADGWLLQIDADSSVLLFGILEASLAANDFALI